MPTNLNNEQQKLIEDEVLKARIRELMGKKEEQKLPLLSKLSANPLMQMILGFILTGLIGTYLSYYYGEKQKENEAVRYQNEKRLEATRNKEQKEKEEAQQKHEKELETQRNEKALELEFARRRTLLELEGQQHLNAKALEFQKTKEMKDIEAVRLEKQKELEFARSQINVVENRKIEQVKVLEQFIKYVNSENSFDRTFGYDIFVSMGYGELAAKLIAEKGDPAGRSALINIANSANQPTSVKQLANVGLAKITDTHIKRILTVLSIFETGKNENEGFQLKFLLYLPGSFLSTAIKNYMNNQAAKYRDELQNYTARIEKNDASLFSEKKYRELINRLVDEELMTGYVEKDFTEKWLNPSLKIADTLGVKTVLGIASILDTRFSHGSVKRCIDFATKENNGTPKNGIDEKKWIRSFTESRMIWIQSRSFARLSYRRVEFFVTEIKRDNWDLLPPFKIYNVEVQ